MFSPLDCGPNARLIDGCELKRQWTGRSATGISVIGAIFKRLIIGRRHQTNRHWCHNLICRLPILVLWTLVMIVVLYKLITNTSPYNETSDFPEIIEHEQITDPMVRQPEPLAEYWLQDDNLIEQHSRKNANNLQDLTLKSSVMPVSHIHTTKQATAKSSTQAILSTTRKSAFSENSRRSDVFILIIQDEDLKSGIITNRAHTNQYPSTIANNHQTTESDRFSSLTQDDFGRHQIDVPNHILHLTEILNSHKIGYTIDTTRFGLPNALMSIEKRHSVIVIDNFVKYTELNRWIRDQLDRHCRAHNIGVMTYLIDEDKLLLNQREILRTSPWHHKRFDNHILQQRSASQESTTPTSKGSAIRTLGDQFPISFRTLRQDCRNLSSTNCLVDYQVSDRVPILRLLKRKADFVIRGELGANLNQMPNVIMSSNHVSYEPITWAKLRRAPRDRRHATARQTISHQLGHVHDEADDARLLQASRNTQHKDYNSVTVGVPVRAKRAAIRQRNEPKNESPLSDDFTGNIVQPSDEAEEELKDDQESSEPVEPGNPYGDTNSDPSDAQVLSMFDRGLYDGIKRVIFGFANNHWLNRMLILDAIEHLSFGDIMSPLERYIQIDIDDIFVGERGTRLNKSDVNAMIETQRDFASFIDGFKFHLGFSGKFYQRGNEAEKLGDEYLVQRAREFHWFCHFFSHAKAHLFNDTESLALEIRKNLHFAREKKLPLIGFSEHQLLEFHQDYNGTTFKLPPTYAVAPHHSGVYPIHEQLFDVWRKVLNVQVTSTEEYPHLKPVNGRRAFVHKTIKVLPRQTCGLYTHTIFKRKYPGGFHRLLASINGGELFETILHDPVNIYMTHMSNYANDRLAPFTFRKLFDFVRANTNIQLRYAPSGVSGNADGLESKVQPQDENNLGPNFLAHYYFALNPNEREPLWTNPCDDRRHLAIWSTQKQRHCARSPSILIVGPQKTGTTALYTFLKLNPQFKSSQKSQQDFEEVQFFNDKHYFKGVDWYFERFDDQISVESTRASDSKYFDKSATYFDDSKVARRAFALLPNAYVITMLLNPADRAYSWFQHMRAHGDLAANKLTFEQMLSWDDSSSNRTTTTITQEYRGLNAAAISLRQRCLHPGYFASHLVNWLNYYPTRQIIIIDGEWFKLNPAAVMHKLQLLLRVKRPIDYSPLLVYDQHKGFYCHQISASEGAKCLGPSKGRRYPPMSEGARAYLNRHYWQHNRHLAKLLYEIGQPLPTWLEETVNS